MEEDYYDEDGPPNTNLGVTDLNFTTPSAHRSEKQTYNYSQNNNTSDGSSDSITFNHLIECCFTGEFWTKWMIEKNADQKIASDLQLHWFIFV